MALDPSASHATSDVKRLILCFDGTWNTPEDRTNVSRLYSAVADKHSGCPNQLKFYDPGVGTTPMEKVRGGVTGLGLDQNILEGYCWLVNEFIGIAGEEPGDSADSDHYASGPDIMLFGFSRGAYTARSLAGLINRCGLLKAGNFEGRAEPKSALVEKAWDFYQKELDAPETRYHPECVAFRREHSWNVRVKLVGVWDTVGALGVPVFSKSVLARTKYGFHDTTLGRTVEHAYHAVAIDEGREDYKVALWTPLKDGSSKYAHQTVEQRWFPGAHSNVGGGYDDDLLPDPPLRWMADRAIAAGLEFTETFQARLAEVAPCRAVLPEEFELTGEEHLSPVRDSYGEFMFGIYRFFRTVSFQGRYDRPMLVEGVFETIDETAHRKWAADPAYRPANLSSAGRN